MQHVDAKLGPKMLRRMILRGHSKHHVTCQCGQNVICQCDSVSDTDSWLNKPRALIVGDTAALFEADPASLEAKNVALDPESNRSASAGLSKRTFASGIDARLTKSRPIDLAN